VTNLPGQRRSASVSVSGSVSDQRKAACVGGSRDGRARSARDGQVGPSVPKPPRGERPAEAGALTHTPYAFRLPRTPHEHAHALAHAARVESASKAARNYQTSRSYSSSSTFQYDALARSRKGSHSR